MSNITVVSSASSEGWKQYAHRMLDGACEFFPSDINILFYYNHEKPQFSNPRVTFIDNYTIEGGVAEFVKKYSKNKKYCGHNPSFENGAYNFRWDAVKFCHKVYAIEHASRICQSNLLFWLDADSVIFDKIPDGWFETLLPHPHYLSYLARPAYTHTDCSFMGFRLLHPANEEFMRRYLEAYKAGRFEEEKESHDSFLFDLVRKEMEREKKITSFNLSKETKGHVFINSELGRYMDTCKGKRKETGSSWRGDLVKDRSEPYWRKIPDRA